jgi:hypothetical protein
LEKTVQLSGDVGGFNLGGVGGGGKGGGRGGSGGGGFKGRKPPIQKTWPQKLQNVLMRSRIGKDGLMPLVGDIVRLLPAEFQGIGVAAQAGIRVATQLAQATMQHISEIRNGYVSGGGTIGQAGAIKGISGGLGFDVSGAGRNLMSGLAPAYAAQAGVNPLGGPFGDNNYNKKTIKLLEYIAKSSSFDQARRRAEGLNEPDLARFYLLTKSTQKQLIQSQGSGPGQGAIVAQNELQAQLALTTKNFLDMSSVLAGPVFITMSNSLSLLNKFWELENEFGGIGLIKEGLNIWNKIAGGPSDDEHKNAVQSNTDAINQLNKSINQGIFGGGPRAQGAIPRAQQRPGYFNNNPMTPMGVL